ncbi:hypothetical protein HUZ36_04445 [Pseudoalteromonas sp. McH1-7]|uniref:hypothetical protein n=1 Tax=Pseudoalteromonas sp. McH1-7 TaxID=2745574 RepID=UPI00158FFE66|nr:hypothetical protein [Pseudoalteromonas sp. McH1-7]NUZ10022.1 hypothetical protein [Pseudoalteromonas sp. McH1-7]
MTKNKHEVSKIKLLIGSELNLVYGGTNGGGLDPSKKSRSLLGNGNGNEPLGSGGGTEPSKAS